MMSIAGTVLFDARERGGRSREHLNKHKKGHRGKPRCPEGLIRIYDRA